MLESHAVKLDSRCAQCYNMLGNLHHRMSAFVASRKAYSNAIALNPTSLESYGNMAILVGGYRLEKNVPEALTWYENAVRVSPNNLRARLQLGNALLMINRTSAQEFFTVLRDRHKVKHVDVKLLVLVWEKMYRAAEKPQKAYLLQAQDLLKDILGRIKGLPRKEGAKQYSQVPQEFLTLTVNLDIHRSLRNS